MSHAEPTPSPSRRWPQLRLSTLFLITAISAAPLAGFQSTIWLRAIEPSDSLTWFNLVLGGGLGISVYASGSICVAGVLLQGSRVATRIVAASFVLLACIQIASFFIPPMQNIIGDLIHSLQLLLHYQAMILLIIPAAFGCIGLLIERTTRSRVLLSMVTFYFAGCIVEALIGQG